MSAPSAADDPSSSSPHAHDPEAAAALVAAGAVQACAGCAALIDVSEQEPLSRIHCPICGTAAVVERKFGHFKIVSLLGQGGMGAVYKALDVNLNRPVALKLLQREMSADPEYIARLEAEARITASMNHPHVVKVFSFGEDQGQYYLALELVDKGSLDDLMQLQGRVAEIQVLEVGRQIAEGLKAAHDAGLIHRDVKPGNILFADAKNAKITDFGLALLADKEAETRGEVWGTPYYIAPEKLNGEPEDHRSDIYSLGGTLFHAIAGRPTFEADNANLVTLKHLKSQAVSLQAFAPDVSPETAYVINRMLHKDPAARYESYAQLIEHLQYAADKVAERTAQPRRQRTRVVVEPEKSRSLAGIFTLALGLALLAGGALAYVYRDKFFSDGKGSGELTASAASALAARRAAEASRTATQSIEEAYGEARKELVAGNFTTAQDRFAQISRRQGLTRPRADWVRFHQILALLLDRQVDAADALIGDELAAGFYSNKQSELRLANFFEQTAKFLSDPGKPVPGSATRAFNNNSVEAFSLLLFGLRDWEVGAVDDAARLLEDYTRGKPPADYAWVEDYEPYAARRLHDYYLYGPLRERLKSATTAAVLEQLLADLDKARGELQSSGKMVELFETTRADVQSRLDATRKTESENEQTRFAAEQDEDKSRWTAAREVAGGSSRLYRFDATLATFNRVGLRGADYQAALTQARARAKLLVEFKRTLIEDLNAPGGGYPQPVISRTNTRFPGGIKRADGEQLQGDTPDGRMFVKWPELDPKTLLTMATYFADKTTDPKAAATRRWLAANFALEFGLIPESRALAERAAKDRPELRAELKPFYDVNGPPKR